MAERQHNTYYGVVICQSLPDVMLEIPENHHPPAKQTITDQPWSTVAPGPTAAPAQNRGALLPIPGKSGYMQVSVACVDATSCIESKDPTAYMPFRRTDGEETTAFQFSIKTIRLGRHICTLILMRPSRWMNCG